MSRKTIEPPIATWQQLVDANRPIPEQVAGGADVLSEFRSQIWSKAEKFSRALGASAATSWQAGAPLIAAGHQPVIYHSGVLRKNLSLSDFARSNQISALNVIIDTDEGIAGKFSFPVPAADGGYRLDTMTISSGESVYGSQYLLEEGALRTSFSAARSKAVPEVQAGLQRAEAASLSFAGGCAIAANASLRRAHEGTPAYLEVRLTDIISLPFARGFFAAVINDGLAFSQLFNQLLDQFRIDRKIKNHANPFPNLAESAEEVELPFWGIDRARGIRAPLRLRKSDRQLVWNGEVLGFQSDAAALFDWSAPEASVRLAPRAVMITALLRLLVSDLFLHGLGGARYDAFLDRLIPAWWEVAAPSFAVVSETRSLFPQELEELDRKQALLGRAREIQFHLDQFLGTGVFTAEQDQMLAGLWEERSMLVEQLKARKAEGGSAADLTQELKRVDSGIKGTLQQFFSSINLPDDQTQMVIRYREFPYFFFEQES